MYEELTQEEQDKIRSGEAEQSLIDKMHRLHNLNSRVREFENPFRLTPEIEHLLLKIDDSSREERKTKIIALLHELHGKDHIQFLSDTGGLLQISIEDWADNLVRQVMQDKPWFAPAGTSVGFIHDPELFVKVGHNEYVHRDKEAEKLGHVDYGLESPEGQSGTPGKEFPCKAEIYINGERYDQQVFDATSSVGNDQSVHDKVRRGVIEDLKREWGADTVEAVDNFGRTVTLTAEQVADSAMKKHYASGMMTLEEPFSMCPREDDLRTIYRQTSTDMHGNIAIDDIYDIRPLPASSGTYGWRADKVLRKGSKTVPKPVRKVTLREKARAQRRARRKSR